MEVVASLYQGRTAAAQCGLFTHKLVPVIFEPPCTFKMGNVKCRILYIPENRATTNLLAVLVLINDNINKMLQSGTVINLRLET